jgi:hypothetical protein
VLFRSTKITALSEDANQVQSWLTTQPDPNGIFKKYDYETLKTNLLEFLNPGEEIPTAVEEVSTTAAETEVAAPTAAPAPFTLESVAKPKKSVDDEFAALFGND